MASVQKDWTTLNGICFSFQEHGSKEYSDAARVMSQTYSNEITDDEKLLVKRCLGFFAGSESLVGNNLLLSAFRFITDAECRQYILRQAFEESLHNLTVVYICDSLDLDIKEVFNAYETVPSIKAKDDFLMEITTDISRQDFDSLSKSGKQEILRNLQLI